MTIQERIISESVGGIAPAGLFSSLADEFGLSRERVRQIAKAIGVRGSRGGGGKVTGRATLAAVAKAADFARQYGGKIPRGKAAGLAREAGISPRTALAAFARAGLMPGAVPREEILADLRAAAKGGVLPMGCQVKIARRHGVKPITVYRIAREGKA